MLRDYNALPLSLGLHPSRQQCTLKTPAAILFILNPCDHSHDRHSRTSELCNPVAQSRSDAEGADQEGVERTACDSAPVSAELCG